MAVRLSRLDYPTRSGPYYLGGPKSEVQHLSGDNVNMDTKFKHLGCEECTMIQLCLEQGYTLRVIARSLQRAPSSNSRELVGC